MPLHTSLRNSLMIYYSVSICLVRLLWSRLFSTIFSVYGVFLRISILDTVTKYVHECAKFHRKLETLVSIVFMNVHNANETKSLNCLAQKFAKRKKEIGRHNNNNMMKMLMIDRGTGATTGDEKMFRACWNWMFKYAYNKHSSSSCLYTLYNL